MFPFKSNGQTNMAEWMIIWNFFSLFLVSCMQKYKIHIFFSCYFVFVIALRIVSYCISYRFDLYECRWNLCFVVAISYSLWTWYFNVVFFLLFLCVDEEAKNMCSNYKKPFQIITITIPIESNQIQMLNFQRWPLFCECVSSEYIMFRIAKNRY